MTSRPVVMILLGLSTGTFLQTDVAISNAEQPTAGRELFTHLWIENDPLSKMGDGLGPVYNERSCVGCHYQAGIGGSGPRHQNVDILTVQIPRLQDVSRREAFLTQLTTLHAGFQSPVGPIPSITLHAYGTHPRYDQRRRGLLEKTDSSAPSMVGIRGVFEELIEPSDAPLSIQFQRTQRSTPALFGAGLLDRVSESVLLRTQKQLSDKFPQVSGRMARLASPSSTNASPTARSRRRRDRQASLVVSGGRPGRFGWRAQISTLDEFVRGACANELGLAVSTQPQPIDPTNPREDLVLDLTDSQCQQMTSYVASLPAPKPQWPEDETQRQLAEQGQVVFERIGCQACHVERLGPAEYVYSDLLLHDMGSGLSDPWPAPSDTTISQTLAYYGGLQTIFSTTPVSQTQREWRTPPLWGSADSAPYLHDGRAETFADAILAHGGEAEFCVTAYVHSGPHDRLALIAFLETLRAPEPTERDKSRQIVVSNAR